MIYAHLLVAQGLLAQLPQPIDLSTPLVIFTDPQQFEQGVKDNTLLNQISNLINATRSGEEITVCVFKFELEDLADQLIRAQNRGVKVRVIINKGDTSKETNKEVKDLFATELHDFHFIENKISDKGIIHNKFILFSAVETSSGPINNLVVQTSSNFQKKGAKKLQDMLIISSPQLYYCYLDFWFNIKVLGDADKLESYDYFTCSDLNNSKAFFFPKRRDEEDYGSDTVLKVLKDIDHPDQAKIRFAHGKWDENREKLAKELDELREAGAMVEVVTNLDVDKEIKKELKGLNSEIFFLDESYNLHTKFFLLEEGGKKQVWTGSHNLTKRSLRENFEVLLKIEDENIYQLYLEYFNKIKQLSSQ